MLIRYDRTHQGNYLYKLFESFQEHLSLFDSVETLNSQTEITTSGLEAIDASQLITFLMLLSGNDWLKRREDSSLTLLIDTLQNIDPLEDFMRLIFENNQR